MNQFSLDILLEFLYNKFAITLVFCFFGSFMREYLTSKNIDSNNKKKSKFNFGKVIISAIFSTFLMCGGADYLNVELHIEVYAIISVILGMWGMGIIKQLMDGKFIYKAFCSAISKSIVNPMAKVVVETTLDDSVDKLNIKSSDDESTNTTETKTNEENE